MTLESNEAPVGASYKAVLRVPHGCDGSPTTAIRVRIPEGIIDVKPMPKPGWTINIVKGKYAKTYSLFRAQVSEGVTELDWSGGSLPDDYYDEFVFLSFLASDLQPGQTIYFPVVQECAKGMHRWIEIPGGIGLSGASAGIEARAEVVTIRLASAFGLCACAAILLLVAVLDPMRPAFAHASLLSAFPADGITIPINQKCLSSTSTSQCRLW